jgi:hypothetical protein
VDSIVVSLSGSVLFRQLPHQIEVPVASLHPADAEYQTDAEYQGNISGSGTRVGVGPY